MNPKGHVYMLNTKILYCVRYRLHFPFSPDKHMNHHINSLKKMENSKDIKVVYALHPC